MKFQANALWRPRVRVPTTMESGISMSPTDSSETGPSCFRKSSSAGR